MRIGLSIGWAALLGIALSGGGLAREADADAAKKDFEAVDYQRRTIYHSPETPGFTCWVHATVLWDNSVLIGFYQATGPKKGRPRRPWMSRRS